jgi:hypothetical protein
MLRSDEARAEYLLSTDVTNILDVNYQCIRFASELAFEPRRATIASTTSSIDFGVTLRISNKRTECKCLESDLSHNWCVAYLRASAAGGLLYPTTTILKHKHVARLTWIKLFEHLKVNARSCDSKTSSLLLHRWLVSDVGDNVHET